MARTGPSIPHPPSFSRCRVAAMSRDQMAQRRFSARPTGAGRADLGVGNVARVGSAGGWRAVESLGGCYPSGLSVRMARQRPFQHGWGGQACLGALRSCACGAGEAGIRRRQVRLAGQPDVGLRRTRRVWPRRCRPARPAARWWSGCGHPRRGGVSRRRPVRFGR